MPHERKRRNLLYPLSKEGYSSWLKTNIDKSKIKIQYAKDLGLSVPAKFHSEQVQISEGRLARLAGSRSRGKMKEKEKPSYMFKFVKQSGK